MSLVIRGKKTGGILQWNYNTLHKIRALAVRYCGCPEYLDVVEMMLGGIPDEVSIEDRSLFEKGRVKAEVQFPNIMQHSDYAGTYTRRGQVDLTTYRTGNSSKLLKELEQLYGHYRSSLTVPADEIRFTKELLVLVRREVEKGSGTILFG